MVRLGRNRPIGVFRNDRTSRSGRVSRNRRNHYDPFLRRELVEGVQQPIHDIRKDLGLPSEIRYYSAEGQHLKTETRPEYDCGEDICTPSKMKMTDHTRGDVATTLIVLERRVNTGIQDSVFSVRSLERAR